MNVHLLGVRCNYLLFILGLFIISTSSLFRLVMQCSAAVADVDVAALITSSVVSFVNVNGDDGFVDSIGCWTDSSVLDRFYRFSVFG